MRPISHVHWCSDGIEDGEDLWRLDLDGDVQVQLFAEVKGDGDTEEYTGKYRLFIEHDVRGAGPDGSGRTKYSAEGWEITSPDAARVLLEAQREVVHYLLIEKINHVKSLPNDPAMCK